MAVHHVQTKLRYAMRFNTALLLAGVLYLEVVESLAHIPISCEDDGFQTFWQMCYLRSRRACQVNSCAVALLSNGELNNIGRTN